MKQKTTGIITGAVAFPIALGLVFKLRDLVTDVFATRAQKEAKNEN